MICYTEIGEPSRYNNSIFHDFESSKSLWDWMSMLEDSSFKRIRLVDHSDIWKSFKKLFGGKS
jgi:hypothetical protein